MLFLLSPICLFVTTWAAARQASLLLTISWSLLKLMSIELVISSNHLILCRPLLLLPSIFLSIRVFSSELALHIIRWPKYWCFGISSSNEYSGLMSLQYSSVAQSCLTLWDSMDCSTPGFPVHRQLLELAQTHVDQVGDAIQTSHPLSSPSPSAFNLSQHQCLSNESVLLIRWPKY